MSSEQVRSVVATILQEELAVASRLDDRFIKRIATRAAEQLAATSTPASLTIDEAAHLRHRLLDWRVNYDTSARLVERLLDGAVVALSAEDLEALRRIRSYIEDSIGCQRDQDDAAVLDRLIASPPAPDLRAGILALIADDTLTAEALRKALAELVGAA